MKKAGPDLRAPLFFVSERATQRERRRGRRTRRKKIPRSIAPTPIMPSAGRIVAVFGAISPASAASPGVIEGSGLADSPLDVREIGAPPAGGGAGATGRGRDRRELARPRRIDGRDVGGVGHHRERLGRARAWGCGCERGRMMKWNHGSDEPGEQPPTDGVCDSAVFSARRGALALVLRGQRRGWHHENGDGRRNVERDSGNQSHQHLSKCIGTLQFRGRPRSVQHGNALILVKMHITPGR